MKFPCFDPFNYRSCLGEEKPRYSYGERVGKTESHVTT